MFITWGPSEFSATGTLQNYDATSHLSDVKVPTLFTVGEFDEIQPEFVRKQADKVANSQVVIFEGSSHMTLWDA